MVDVGVRVGIKISHIFVVFNLRLKAEESIRYMRRACKTRAQKLTVSFRSWMKNCLHLKEIFTIFNLQKQQNINEEMSVTRPLNLTQKRQLPRDSNGRFSQ